MNPLSILVFAIVLVLQVSAQNAIQLQYGLQAQRPPVARVNTFWNFTLLADTFQTSNTPAVSYTANGLPAWCTFDASNLIFTGTPQAEDVGDHTVQLVATAAGGSTAQDSFDMLVSAEAPPTAPYPIASQLSDSSSLPEGCVLHYNNALRVPPGWHFTVDFRTNSVVSAESGPVFWTAYLLDTTSLPSWLYFNNNTVTFEGTSPNGGEYNITMFASDHYGYGDVVQHFTIVSDAHHFDMSNPLPALNATSGQAVTYPFPIRLFSIDDITVTPANITINPDLSAFPELSYQPSSQSIVGTIQASTNNQTNLQIPVTFYSSYGQQINATLPVDLETLFTTSTPPSITLTPGKTFEADLSQYLKSSTAQVSASFSPQNATAWANVYSNGIAVSNSSLRRRAPDLFSSLFVNGTAPIDPSTGNVSLTLNALDPTNNATGISTILLAFPQNATAADGNLNHGSPSTGLTRGAIIALGVVLGLLAALALLTIAICCCRRKREKAEKAAISHPVSHDNDKYAHHEDPFASNSAIDKGKGKERDEVEDQHLDKLAAIYTGRKVDSNRSIPHSPSQSTNRSGPRRFNLLNFMRRGDSSSDIGTSNNSIRHAGISRPVPHTASHDVVIMEEDEEGNTYDPADRSDSSSINHGTHDVDSSTWGSKGSSSLFYSDDGSPRHNRSANGTPKSVPRQRRDFMRKAPVDRNKVGSPIPYPVPAGVRLVHSESQQTNASSDNSSLLSRKDPFRTVALTTANLTRIPPQAETLESPRASATPRLIPFTSEKHVERSELSDSKRANSQPLEALDVSTSDAPDSFHRASVAYQPPDVGDSPAVSPVFYSPSQIFSTPMLGSSTNSQASTSTQRNPVAPSIRTVDPVLASSMASNSPKPNRYFGGTAAANANSPRQRGHNRTNTGSSIVNQVRVVVAVGEPFHFTPTLTPPPAMSSPGRKSGPKTNYLALTDYPDSAEVDRKPLPEWLHFSDLEFWGIPTEEDCGSVCVQILEQKAPSSPRRLDSSTASSASSTHSSGLEETIVGRFVLKIIDKRSSVISTNQSDEPTVQVITY